MLNAPAKKQTLTIQTSTKCTFLSNNLKTKKIKPQQTQLQKTVTFSRQVLVHPILSCNDYTDKEFQACWYTNADKRTIRREVNQILRRMNGTEDQEGLSTHDASHKSIIDTNNDITRKRPYCCSSFASPGCTRGLEFQTQQGAKICRRRRKRASNIVFDIQKEQFSGNLFDEYEIAIAYSKLTAKSKLQAYIMGLTDAQYDNDNEAKPNSIVLPSLRGKISLSKR